MIVQDYENNQWLSRDPRRGLLYICMYTMYICYVSRPCSDASGSDQSFILTCFYFLKRLKHYSHGLYNSFPFQFALLTKFSFWSVFMALLHSLLILLAEYNKKWHTLASFLSSAIFQLLLFLHLLSVVHSLIVQDAWLMDLV